MSITLVDFKDIVDAVAEELKVQAEDTNTIARIKRVINETYLQEIVPFANWKWLEGHTAIKFNAAYFGGTASVTPNSTTVILSTAPSVSLGSFAGKLFSTDSFNESYIISAHTAGSTTVTLSAEYLGTLDSAVTFKIWTDKINLPTDCRETVSVYTSMNSRPMEGVGRQKFRELSLLAPKTEGYPRIYYTGDYYDPTSGTGEMESDRYRQMSVFPSVTKSALTVYIDYLKDVTELTNDGDEPILPIQDRIVIKYGALKTLWRSVGRNPEEAAISFQEFNARLNRMAGKIEDSTDYPKVSPDSSYVRRRRSGKYRISGFGGDFSPSSGGGNAAITYLENVTINGGTITNDITVTSGKTIDGVDISVLKNDFDAHLVDAIDAHDASAISYSNATSGLAADEVQEAIDLLAAGTVGKTSVTLTDNTSNQVAYSVAVATATVVRLNYSIVRMASNIESGIIILVTDGTNASIAQGAAASLGTLGVTFTTDVSGSNLRLLSTTTSTGSDATFKYSVDAFLA